MWKLYNDTEVKLFMDWGEVVQYCISSKCIPTLLFFESKASAGYINKFKIAEETYQILQITAMEQD
jgi:hypothetical protein